MPVLCIVSYPRDGYAGGIQRQCVEVTGVVRTKPGWRRRSAPAIVWYNQGLIVPLTDLQQVLILGDVPPPGYAVLTFSPILTLNDFVFC